MSRYVILAGVALIAARVDAQVAVPTDTVLTLGSRSIDMTGDGRAEMLVLAGTGPSIDSLEVTFQIVASGSVLYAASLRPITRAVGYDRPMGTRTAAQQAEFVSRFGREFFADAQFVPASRFLSDLRGMAPRRVADIPSVIARHRATYEDHAVGRLERVPLSTDTTGAGAIWADMLTRDRIVFRFSPGGDGTTAIAWSGRDRRFYRLLECC
jgi:hypothetical protein